MLNEFHLWWFWGQMIIYLKLSHIPVWVIAVINAGFFDERVQKRLGQFYGLKRKVYYWSKPLKRGNFSKECFETLKNC